MTITITPNELLDTTTAQLRTLAAFLREQLGHGTESTTSAAPQTLACREALAALSVLILRLQAARESLADAGGPSKPERTGMKLRLSGMA